ncbi:chemotaxis protein CheY [Kosmotoga arenicorallina S304]|uniref:Chemotaxis protein CheY n=1 Tax=Kosmotoga arenicorallina S304 TaxID=1453497 RepID=A0A176K4C0_9BACT|nr:response regulator [Kosmotoga arenicorallina]OAA31902.1 chemotaxis protein CheY [Kosmotoga arenicorallina S304]
MSKRILIVEDEENMRLLLEEEFSDEGFETISTASGKNAIEILKENVIDLATIDIEMPDMNGLELAGLLRKEYPELKIILLTAYSHYKQDLSSWAADAYIVKSSDLNELKETVKELLK